MSFLWGILPDGSLPSTAAGCPECAQPLWLLFFRPWHNMWLIRGTLPAWCRLWWITKFATFPHQHELAKGWFNGYFWKYCGYSFCCFLRRYCVGGHFLVNHCCTAGSFFLFFNQSVALHQSTPCKLGGAMALKTQIWNYEIWNWNITWDSNVGTQASPTDTCARKAKHNSGIPIGTFTFKACKSSNWHQKHLGDRGRRKGRQRRRTRHNNNAREGADMWPLPSSSSHPFNCAGSTRLYVVQHPTWNERRSIYNAADMPLTSLTSWVKKVPAITDGTTLGLIFKKYKEKTRAASLHYTSTRWIQSIWEVLNQSF